MGLTKSQDIWSCHECGELKGRHDLWFDGICEDCNTEKQEFKLDSTKTSNKFKEYLAKYMAEIDFINFPSKTFDQHYANNMELRDFDLLKYWLEYNGVFDGGEDMLNKLKILL